MSWLAFGTYRGPQDAAFFLRFAKSFAKERYDTHMYRVYVTDCLKPLAGARERWADWVNPRPSFDVDEVIEDVITRAGLEVV